MGPDVPIYWEFLEEQQMVEDGSVVLHKIMKTLIPLLSTNQVLLEPKENFTLESWITFQKSTVFENFVPNEAACVQCRMVFSVVNGM